MAALTLERFIPLSAPYEVHMEHKTSHNHPDIPQKQAQSSDPHCKINIHTKK